MSVIRQLARASLLIGLFLSSVMAQEKLPLVSFSEALSLESGGQITVFSEGSPAYFALPGQETSVLSGEAVFQYGSAAITAVSSTRFTYLVQEGAPRVTVHAGSLKVSMGGVSRVFSPGETVDLRAPLAMAAAAALPTTSSGDVSAPGVPAPTKEPVAPAPEPAALGAEAPVPPTPSGDVSAPSGEPRRSWKINMELKPFYSLKESYDSNIYRVPRDKPGAVIVGGGVVGSWITNNTLGAKLLIPLSRSHKAEAQYKISATNYSRQSRANDAYDNSVDFNYIYSGKRLKTKAFNTYTNTEIPAFSEIVVRERRWQNNSGFSAEVEQGRSLVYTIDGQHSVHKYVARTLGGILNHYEQSLGGSFGYKIMPKTKLYAAYHRSIVHYSAGRQANSKAHAGDLGIEGQLTTKIKGRIQAGFQQRRYDELTGVPRIARNWQGVLDLHYAVTRQIKMTLSGSRAFTESTSNRNRYYIGSNVRSTIKYDLKRYALGVNGSYQVDRYPESDTQGGITATRRDDLYSGGLTGEYRLKEWLNLTASYSHLARFSIFSGQFNYRAHVSGLEISISFK